MMKHASKTENQNNYRCILIFNFSRSVNVCFMGKKMNCAWYQLNDSKHNCAAGNLGIILSSGS